MDCDTEIILWTYLTLEELEFYLRYCPKKKNKILKYLSIQANPDLIKVASIGDLESVQYLLKLGKTPTVATVEWAIRSGSLAVFEILYNIIIKNTNNNSHLNRWISETFADIKLQLSCVAVESSQLEILKYLNPKAQKETYQETILNLAVMRNNLEIVQYLLDQKIGPYSSTFRLASPESNIKKLLRQYKIIY